MPKRSIWSGAISFGLVVVPVKLYPATEQKDIRFHQFKEGTDQRIRNKRVSEQTGREVDYPDIVKGYEVEKGKFVIVIPEELEGVAPEKTRTIEIQGFVDIAEIDPIYYEKTYYLAPDGQAGAQKAYALLLRAMKDEGMVAIGRFVMRTKEYLAAVRPMDGILVLETMFFPDEIRDTSEVENVPVRRQAGDRELKMAKQLIGSLATEWDPKRYHDEYRERVLKLIRDKAKGKEVVLPEAAALASAGRSPFFVASMLWRRASMRSATLEGSGASGRTTSLPLALSRISLSTRARYSSW